MSAIPVNGQSLSLKTIKAESLLLHTTITTTKLKT